MGKRWVTVVEHLVNMGFVAIKIESYGYLTWAAEQLQKQPTCRQNISQMRPQKSSPRGTEPPCTYLKHQSPLMSGDRSTRCMELMYILNEIMFIRVR